MNILGFDYPPHLHYWLERDVWAERRGDGSVRVGVTAFGVHISGHFFMCRPKPPGTVLAQGQTLAVVELNKSIVTLKTPVAGTVLRVNEGLTDAPELIEQDPYGAGWIAELQASDWAQDQTLLHHGDSLLDAATARMQLERLQGEEGPI